MNFKALSHYGFVMFFCVAALSSDRYAYAEEKCTGKELVVLGDSLVAGFGLPPGESYPDKLAEALGEHDRGLIIINAGVSGDTTGGGLARLDWSVSNNARAVILELGANDGMRGIPLDQIRSNLGNMIGKLRSRNIEVLLMGMLAPPNMGTEYGDEFRKIYSDLSNKHSVELYPFFLDGVAADPSLNLDDGIHPNSDGIAVLVERTLPAVKNLIKEACPN